MNDRLKKQLYTYKRRLEDKKIYTGVYTIILFLSIIIYGLFGLLPFYKVTREKMQTINNLKDLNSKLSLKVDDMIAMRDTLEKVKFYTQNLEGAITTSPKLEDYLVDLVTAAGGKGFSQKSFYKQGQKDGVTNLAVRFQGSSGQLLPFIKSVENIHRLTKITGINYNIREDIADVQLKLQIFYLER